MCSPPELRILLQGAGVVQEHQSQVNIECDFSTGPARDATMQKYQVIVTGVSVPEVE